VEQLNSAFKISFQEISMLYPNFGSNKMSSREWWNQVVASCFEKAGVKASPLPSSNREDTSRILKLADNLYDLFSGNTCYQCFPETKIVLRNLHGRNVKLGVISNSDERLHGVIRKMNLHQFFDFVITSKEIGFQKPYKEIFQKALEIASVEPWEALHVGDSECADYNGAKKAGMHALLLSRDGSQAIDSVDHNDLIPDLMPLHQNYASDGESSDSI